MNSALYPPLVHLLQFMLKLKDLWVPPNQDIALDTGFVVIGPIDKELHLTTG